MKKDFQAVFVLLLISLQAGCTSITSTMLNRTESDQLVGNSNGAPKQHCATRPYKGVPITLRVPTHVDVAVHEKVRLALVGDDLRPLTGGHRHLWVDSQLIYTDKVFTVDVKRPAAGTSKYTMEFGGKTEQFDNRQYFKKLESKIVDETIKDVTGAINTIFEAVPTARQEPTQEDGEKTKPVFFDEQRMVAWKRFDLDAVDFEHQVAAFVATHMNNCHSCGSHAPAVGPPVTTDASVPMATEGFSELP